MRLPTSRLSRVALLAAVFASTNGALCSDDGAEPTNVPYLGSCDRPSGASPAQGYMGARGETPCDADKRCIVEPNTSSGMCWAANGLCKPDTYVTVNGEQIVPSVDCTGGKVCRVQGNGAWFGNCVQGTGGAGGSGGAGGTTSAGMGGAGGSQAGMAGAGGGTNPSVALCSGKALPPVLPHDPSLAADGFDFVVDCLLDVTTNVSISPGARIGFAPGAGVSVSGGGKLVAEGTSTDHIRFAPMKAGENWTGVQFFSAGASSMRFVDIAGAGQQDQVFGEGAAVRVGAESFAGGEVSIRDCVIDSGGVGLSIGKGGKLGALTNVSITAASFPVESVVAALGGLAGTGNTLSGAKSAVHLLEEIDPPAVTVAWPALGIPFRAESTVRLLGTHTMGKGIAVELAKGASLLVQGTQAGQSQLTIDGVNATTPVTLAGLATTPGSWGGIVLAGAKLTMSHAKLSNGGEVSGLKPPESAMVLVDPNTSGSEVSIRDCVFEGSSSFAISLHGAPANADLETANTFSNNLLGSVAK